MKMNVDAVTQVILETSKSPGNNVIKMKNRVQKLNAHWESCNEIRDEIIPLLPDSQIAEETQKWIEYQQAIDNTLDIAQHTRKMKVLVQQENRMGFERLKRPPTLKPC